MGRVQVMPNVVLFHKSDIGLDGQNHSGGFARRKVGYFTLVQMGGANPLPRRYLYFSQERGSGVNGVLGDSGGMGPVLASWHLGTVR